MRDIASTSLKEKTGRKFLCPTTFDVENVIIKWMWQANMYCMMHSHTHTQISGNKPRYIIIMTTFHFTSRCKWNAMLCDKKLDLQSSLQRFRLFFIFVFRCHKEIYKSNEKKSEKENAQSKQLINGLYEIEVGCKIHFYTRHVYVAFGDYCKCKRKEHIKVGRSKKILVLRS